MFEESSVYPYRLRKSFSGKLTTREFDTSIRTNSLGYRGKELSPANTRVRVLALGDSFTFGWGVNDEDTYPERLETQLRSRIPDRDIEVINGGFAGGYSPDTYYLYLKTEGEALKPDLIIVGFFIGNDIDHPMGLEHEWTSVDANGFPLAIQNRFFEVKDNLWISKVAPLRYRIPVLTQSHLFQGAVHSFERAEEFALKVARRISGLAHLSATDNNASVPFIYRKVYTERTNTAVSKVQKLFLEMTRISTNRGIPILFAMFPAREQMFDAPFDDAAAQLDKPQAIFSRFFQEHRIAYVDLLESFREASKSKNFYYQLDSHWNSDGNILAAKLIAEFIETHYALKVTPPDLQADAILFPDR